MKLLTLSPSAYESYKRDVNGNENISFDQAVRKLSRNIQLVKEYIPERIKGLFATKTYPYGNLDIVTRFGKIVKLTNHKGRYINFKIDEKRYIELTKEYGIKTN